MDCFHDFCLACDRESTSGPYCSQACRLADLERATASYPSSPTTSAPLQPTKSATTPSSHSNGSGYFSYNSSQRSRDYSKPTLSQDSLQDRSYFMRSPSSPITSAQTDTNQKALTPSSSRSSLSSTASTSNVNAISEQAKAELQDYFSSFHTTKASKRRQSTW